MPLRSARDGPCPEPLPNAGSILDALRDRWDALGCLRVGLGEGVAHTLDQTPISLTAHGRLTSDKPMGSRNTHRNILPNHVTGFVFPFIPRFAEALVTSIYSYVQAKPPSTRRTQGVSLFDRSPIFRAANVQQKGRKRDSRCHSLSIPDTA